MNYLRVLCLLLISVYGATAQTGATDTIRSGDTQYVLMDTLRVSVPAGPIQYRSTEPRVWNIQHTRIALSFDMKQQTATVKEWIKLRPYFYATDTLVLDAKGMKIDSVLLTGVRLNTAVTRPCSDNQPRYIYEHDQLKIYFCNTYFATDTLELHLQYTAMPYAANVGGSSAITDDRGLYFINTDNKVPYKPAQIWTQGETESNSHWMITIDKPNTRFTTQVELTVPDSFVSLSNGAMVKQTKSNGYHTDVWKMDMPIQAYAVMFAIGNYSFVKDKWKDKEVIYYVEKSYEPYARLMFKHTVEMMDFFSKRTGVAYPWNKYSQVVVRDYVSGAMENTTASLFGEFINQNAREIADKNAEDVVSHELFHQWFGDYVTAESWSNVTMNESFANYGEQLWRTYKYGIASGEELAYNDLQGYINASKANDPQLVRFYYDDREELFDGISYNKGGSVLRYINSIVGDAAFDRAMNIYLTRNALGSAEAHNWRMALEEATGQDWNLFFNQWYFHAGHPILKMSYDYNDSTQQLKVTVNQAQSDSTYNYKVALKTMVAYGNNKTIETWDINRKMQTYIYPYINGQKPLIIPDFNHVLPGEVKESKKHEQWLHQYIISQDIVNKRLAVAAAGRILSDSNSQEIIDRSLNDTLSSIRKQSLSVIRNTQNDKNRARWIDKVTSMAVSDKNNMVRAEALSVLGDWKVANAKDIMIKALADSSYYVSGEALEAINKLDKDTAYILAKQLVKTDPKSVLESAVWSVIMKKGTVDDINLIEAHAPYVQGARKFPFASSLSNYLRQVKSEVSFSRAAEVFGTLVVNDNMRSYRSSLGRMLAQVGEDQKKKLKSEQKDEAENGKKQLEMVKRVLARVIAAETDEENRKDFTESLKDLQD